MGLKPFLHTNSKGRPSGRPFSWAGGGSGPNHRSDSSPCLSAHAEPAATQIGGRALVDRPQAGAIFWPLLGRCDTTRKEGCYDQLFGLPGQCSIARALMASGLADDRYPPGLRAKAPCYQTSLALRPSAAIKIQGPSFRSVRCSIPAKRTRMSRRVG